MPAEGSTKRTEENGERGLNGERGKKTNSLDPKRVQHNEKVSFVGTDN